MKLYGWWFKVQASWTLLILLICMHKDETYFLHLSRQGLECTIRSFFFTSTSQTVNLFLCFAPQMALRGFFIEASFSYNLYDLPPYAATGFELTSESCTSLRGLDSGCSTNRTIAAVARLLSLCLV